MDSFFVAEEIVNDLTSQHPVMLPFRDHVVNVIMNKFDEYGEEIVREARIREERLEGI